MVWLVCFGLVWFGLGWGGVGWDGVSTRVSIRVPGRLAQNRRRETVDRAYKSTTAFWTFALAASPTHGMRGSRREHTCEGQARQLRVNPHAL